MQEHPQAPPTGTPHAIADPVGDPGIPAVLPATPWNLLFSWFAEAQQAAKQLRGEPGTASLATVDERGMPDVRIVLLKTLSVEGVVFYSDDRSAKAHQIAAMPHVALCLYWPEFHRQVRIRGDVVCVPDDVAQQHFATMPRGAQIAAWASHQSAPMFSREALQEGLLTRAREFGATSNVQAPPSWVGYQVRPNTVEFWLGDSSRLHDRASYTTTTGMRANLDDPEMWAAVRLQP